MVPNLPRCRSTRELYVSESALQQLDDFLKENGFENLGIQPVFFHMFIIFYHLSMFWEKAYDLEGAKSCFIIEYTSFRDWYNMFQCKFQLQVWQK